jgi:hypothetical protein
MGSIGSEVALVQSCLVVPVDGDFGAMTDQGVRAFQAESRLTVDGVVGPDTWAALEQAFALPPYPPPMLPELDAPLVDVICMVAENSEIAAYSWPDRGEAPIGYVKGMALAYATAWRKLSARNSSALVMAQAATDDPDTDALAWYSDVFDELGMPVYQTGPDTLRYLFVLMMGLGMRESSGQHCEGRDMSAENTTSDTCEAGLFQTSWNINSCSTEIRKLLDEYDEMPNNCQQCWRSIFEEDVSCSADDWENYGTGTGALFQQLSKECPQFAVESTAVGLRLLRKHWGPIGRREVEVRKEADDLFRAVENLLEVPVA